MSTVPRTRPAAHLEAGDIIVAKGETITVTAVTMFGMDRVAVHSASGGLVFMNDLEVTVLP